MAKSVVPFARRASASMRYGLAGRGALAGAVAGVALKWSTRVAALLRGVGHGLLGDHAVERDERCLPIKNRHVEELAS